MNTIFKVKIIEDGKMPTKANPSDAGFDCFVRQVEPILDGQNNLLIIYRLGFSLEMPEGWAALLYQRSSVFNYDLSLANAVGVIDSGFRGEIQAIFRVNKKNNAKIYKVGDKICQIIPYKLPEVKLELVEELNMDNDRGGGFGSTGQ